MNNNQSGNKRIAKNTAFLYIRMVLVLFVSLFTTRVILRSLGVVDYGIYNVVSGFVSMFAFLNTSMANGIQRFYNFKLGQRKDGTITEEYNTALQIQLILAIVLLIIFETIGIWYINNKMVIPQDRFVSAMWVYHFSIISLVLVIMQSPHSAAIMAKERMDFYAYVSIFEVIAKLVVAYGILYYNTDKLVLYGVLQLLVSVITFLLYFIYCKCNFKDLRFERIFEKDLFKSMFSFFGWNTFGTFAYMIKGQGLNMLLNVFFGPVVNAARGVAFMIMTSLQSFQVNIVIAFRPQMIQSYALNDYERVCNLFFTLSRVSFVLVSILSLPIIFELDYILHLWLGDVVPEYTITFTILVLLNLIVSSLTNPVSVVVAATGKMKKYQLITGTIVCMILPVSWLFLKLGCDPNSVFIVSLVFTIINQVVCINVLNGLFKFSISDYFKQVIMPCFIFLILSFLLCSATQIMEASFVRFVISLFWGILASAVIAYLIALNKQEKNYIKVQIQKIKKIVI